MSTHRLALPALIFASIIGGTIPIAIKFAFLELGPFTVLFSRFLIASIILTPIALHKKFPLHRQFIHQSLLLSAFLIGNVTLFIVGIKSTTAITAGLLYTLTTLFIAFLTKLRRKSETITLNQWLGLALGLIGAGLIIIRSFTPPLDPHSIGTPLGNFTILLAVISYTLYIYKSQPLTRHYSPLHLTTVNFIIITIFALPLALWEISSHPVTFPITYLSLGSIIYVATIASVGMYFLY